jgi:predicted TIM-barrel fold metal-dependent hydrolase
MSENEPPTKTPRARWRASVVEDVLRPELPICDAHHHLWDHAGDRYLASEFAADVCDGHNVVASVYVECGSAYRQSAPAHFAPVGETEFVMAREAELAALLGRPLIRGIIGHADLRLGRGVADVLNAHIEVADGRFAGVRHAVAWDASPDIVNHQADPPAELLLDPHFTDGVRTLGAMDLTYDAWLYHPQLPELVALARAAPATTIVLDHLGAPLGIGPYAGKREGVLEFCREHLAALAALPNTRIKLGGIGMPSYGNRWHRLDTPPGSQLIAATWGDHFRWCIDTFGPERAMFESNFPPDGRSCSYRTLWNAYKRIAEPYSEQEQARLFHDTAVAVYGL